MGSSKFIWYGNLCIRFENSGGMSPAEQNVIQLLLGGYTTAQIADICARSIKTISAQKKKAFRRLNIRNEATLLLSLLLLGVVTIHQMAVHNE
ncbi:helix-turn-helix transcriptional regulator [Salmonella enterica subsp. enterica serovar Enteritidis]|nr:helix-turn-helix transcriptional regulator [Salmonella enterica subsp. enterica serovar Enteritidis]